MAQDYDNKNTGILRANKDRREGKNDPTHKGSINADGVEYWLSGWVKEGREGTKLAGEKYFSFSLKRKDDKQAASPNDQRREDGADDIPF